MTTPKAVVFDLGKVLVEFDYRIAAAKLAGQSRLAAREFYDFVAHSPWLLRYERGLMTKEEFFREICAGTGFRGEIDDFGRSFGDIFHPIEPMIEIHAALRKKGVPTYIFSNTNELAIAQIRRQFPFFAGFDGYVFSYEHQAMKPEVKLYEALEELSGRTGPDLLYLDDRPENIEAGAARGWQVILQESPEKTRAAMQQLGLLNHA